MRPRIRTIKPDPLADAEFAGFFWGEGSLDIIRQGRAEHHLFPRARVGLRADDLPMLKWAQSRFGGSLTYRAPTDSWSWQLTGSAGLAELLDVLEAARLPAKKRREVALIREALATVKAGRRTLPPAVLQRRMELQSELRALKQKVMV